MTLSTTKTAFVADAGAANQAIWMKKFLEELGHLQDGCITILCE